MANRYKIIKETVYDNYIFEEHPVRIEVSRILKDELTGNKVVQFKIKNVSDSEIDNITIKVTGFDVADSILATVDDFSLADINAKPGDEFGGNSPVVLEDNRVSKVNIVIKRVVSKSGKEWINKESFSGQLYDVEREELVYNEAQKIQLFRLAKERNFRVKNMFSNKGQYWVCSCGAINSIKVDKCYKCKVDIANLNECFDESYLQKLVDEQIEKDNNERYARADELSKVDASSKVERAQKIFEMLEDWKDAKKRSDECRIKAEQLKQKENYASAENFASKGNVYSITQAIELYKKLGNYKDSKEKLEINEKLLDRMKKEEAESIAKKEAKIAMIKKISIITGAVLAVLLIAFLIIKSNMVISVLKKAENYRNNGEYEQAFNVLENSFFSSDLIDNMKSEYKKEYGFIQVESLIEKGDLDAAMKIADSGELDNQSRAYFLIGNAYYNMGYFLDAYTAFSKCGETVEGLSDEEIAIYDSLRVDLTYDEYYEYDEWLEYLADEHYENSEYAEAQILYTALSDSFHVELCKIAQMATEDERKEYVLFECDKNLLLNRDFQEAVSDLGVKINLFGEKTAYDSEYIVFDYVGWRGYDNESTRDRYYDEDSQKYFTKIEEKFGVTKDVMEKDVKEEDESVTTTYSFVYKNRTITLELYKKDDHLNYINTQYIYDVEIIIK